MVRAAGVPRSLSAALVLLGLVLGASDDVPRPDLPGAADPCYGAAVEGRAALLACAPDPEQLAVAVVGMLQRQTSGSEAEAWIRIGTRLHDLVVEGAAAPRGGSGNEGLSGARCHSRATDPRWHGALVLSRRAILTGLRLVADPRSAPLSGTHAGLFLSRTLIHPCTAADLPALPGHADLRHGAGRAGGSWAAVAPRARRFAQSGNTGQTHDGGLEQAAKEARERGDCGAAVRLIHAAAAAAPDAVGVWYTLQITMMECGVWDFSEASPTPPELLRDPASTGGCSEVSHAPPTPPELLRDPSSTEGAVGGGAGGAAGGVGECATFAIVSAASHQYFDRAKNLVGSVHVWDRAAAEARGWAGVEVRALDFARYPPHLQSTGWEKSTYAFKPLVVWDALKTHDCILWLDSGIELRRNVTSWPYGIELRRNVTSWPYGVELRRNVTSWPYGIELRRNVTSWAPPFLSRYGALLIASGWPFPNAWLHPLCATALLPPGANPLDVFRDAHGHFLREVWSGVMGFNRNDADAHGHFLREVWSGVMGFNRNDEALMRDIVQPMMLCALDPQCIAPAGSNKSNQGSNKRTAL
ncbi:hypothetical protein T484DRAFT_1772676 [Baffinella frigidus]|nr:hypothetical protein T484DRAFT_1772676 [Cryptophyta sp. CCMP2293]